MKGQSNIPDNPFRRGEELLNGINRPELTKYVSVVFAVSATAYMRPFWDYLGSQVQKMQQMLSNAMSDGGWKNAEIRMRFIAFKDMYMFSDPFLCSPFCLLPHDSGTLTQFTDHLGPQSRSTYRCSGLEALFLAMHSDWVWNDHAVKHVIVLVADAPPYDLRTPLRTFGRRYESVLDPFISNHDLPVPGTLEELHLCWLNGVGTMDNWNNFLLLYVPDCIEWREVATWDEVTLRAKPKNEILQLKLEEVFTDICSVSGMA